MNKILLVLGITFIYNIQAADLTIPNTFTAGTPAVAADVNANFTAVESAVDDNNTNITTNATGITTNAAGIITNDARIMALEAAYVIGDTGPAGGWVFYVDVEGRHGLEAAFSDQSVSIRWDNGTSTNTEARGDGVGAGEMNTMLIIAMQEFDSNNYAAGICANLVITNADVDYGDWYLPSKYELNLMWLNIGQGNTTLGNVGGFTDFFYWSSSEVDGSLAWLQNFFDGIQADDFKDFAVGVRAVRAF